MTKQGNRRANAGMAVVAVMVLIAILFLTGTVMALAVSSNLRTVDVTSHQDAVHYAAESAVARGVVAAGPSAGCSLSGSINHEDFAATCRRPLLGVAPNSVPLLSAPGRRLVGPDSLTFQLALPHTWKAVWTVIGWRTPDSSSQVRVWIDGADNCDTKASFPTASPVYTVCQLSGEDDGDQPGQRPGQTSATLHIAVGGGSVDLGGFVVRAALTGSGRIVTVVGKAGTEVDEADVGLPGRTVTLWNTLLP